MSLVKLMVLWRLILNSAMITSTPEGWLRPHWEIDISSFGKDSLESIFVAFVKLHKIRMYRSSSQPNSKLFKNWAGISRTAHFGVHRHDSRRRSSNKNQNSEFGSQAENREKKNRKQKRRQAEIGLSEASIVKENQYLPIAKVLVGALFWLYHWAFRQQLRLQHGSSPFISGCITIQ